MDQREKIVVGVNDFQIPPEQVLPVPTLRISEEVPRRQLQRLAEVKARRDARAVERALERLAAACRGDENTFPFILDAVRTYATVGEIAATMRTVFGVWEETAVI